MSALYKWIIVNVIIIIIIVVIIIITIIIIDNYYYCNWDCSSVIVILLSFLPTLKAKYQNIILARMEEFYSPVCRSIPLVFEFLILFINVCIFTDYVE